MNLKINSVLNQFSLEDVERLWYPWINLKNIHSSKSYGTTGIEDIWHVITNETYSYKFHIHTKNV